MWPLRIAVQDAIRKLPGIKGNSQQAKKTGCGGIR